MHDDIYYHELLASFIVLGEMLGFTWEQIEKAYLRKNAVNHQRQESGY
jgi:dimeric dUTPase (all-alpha-NTP-PPase superfamily)